MAFSFGAAASAPTFGAPSAGQPGLSATPSFSFAPAAASSGAAATTSSFSFGASAASSTASLFGGSSAPSLFGASSTPGLFGGTTATASLFGAASQPAASSSPSLFGAASSPSLFGASGTPAAGTSLFGAGPASAASTSSPFSFGTTAGYPSSWAGSLQVGAPAAQAVPTLLTYATKFEDLHPNVQKELQDIQREISAYRDDCDRLSRDQRLHDSAALKKSLEEETQALKRSLEALAGGMQADDDALADFRHKVMTLLRSTEAAVRTYQRARLWREAPTQYKGQLMPPQLQELLAAPVVLPNPYLDQAIQGFAEALDAYRQVVGELEAAVPPGAAAAAGGGLVVDASLATTLPTVVSHMHDFFVHVAAQLEQLHGQVEASKAAFLAQRQASGDMTNPFADARRSQHLHALASARPVVIPPASHHQHAGVAYGHGAGYALHAGTAHGPGGTPLPGAFGTPLGGYLSPMPGGQQTAGVDGGANDPNRKATKGRRK